MKLYSLLFLLIIIFQSSLSASFNYNAIKLKIEKHYYSFNISDLESILKECKAIQKAHPDESLSNYYLGFIYHQLGKIYYNPKPLKAEEYFENSIEFLERSLEKDYNSECEALLSSAYGKKASFSTITAFYWGLKSKSRIEHANSLDANNPKVHLIAAIHLMHIPESYGGDKKRSEQLLMKALKSNNNHQGTLNWAEDAEIYAYFAQLEILRNNPSKARNYMNKALELEKDYGFVLIDLEEQLK